MLHVVVVARTFYTLHFYSCTGPQPPMGISVVANGCNSANMSWTASVSRMCDAVIGNYSVRYQLMSGEGGYVTVSSSSTSVTLQGLDPNAEYTVSVAGINSCGGMSTFTTTQFKFQGTVTPVYSPRCCYVLLSLMSAPYHCNNASC